MKNEQKLRKAKIEFKFIQNVLRFVIGFVTYVLVSPNLVFLISLAHGIDGIYYPNFQGWHVAQLLKKILTASGCLAGRKG